MSVSRVGDSTDATVYATPPTRIVDPTVIPENTVPDARVNAAPLTFTVPYRAAVSVICAPVRDASSACVVFAVTQSVAFTASTSPSAASSAVVSRITVDPFPSDALTGMLNPALESRTVSRTVLPPLPNDASTSGSPPI